VKRKKSLIFLCFLCIIYVLRGDSEELYFRLNYTIGPKYGGIPELPVKCHIENISDGILHIKVECSYHSKYPPIAQQIDRDFAGGYDDRILVLIDIDRDNVDGYVFMINSLNIQSDSKITNVSEYDKNWNTNWKSDVKFSDSMWIADLYLPLNILTNLNVDSININVYRLAIQRKNGVFEASTLVKPETGIDPFGLTKMKTIPFKIRPKKYFGYILPYLKLHNNTAQALITDIGTELQLNILKHKLMFAMWPDFDYIGADAYSLDITANRLYISENRQFFLENKQYTKFLVNTFYSKKLSDEMPWGVQYKYNSNQWDFFLLNSKTELFDLINGENTNKKLILTMGAMNFHKERLLSQMNLSQLKMLGKSDSTIYHADWQLTFTPNAFELRTQFSYDFFKNAPVFAIDFNRPNSGVGWNFNANFQYISPEYSYTLAYLPYNNNNWQIGIGADYNWRKNSHFFSESGISANFWQLNRIKPSQVTLIRSFGMSFFTSVFPSTRIFYQINLDDRPFRKYTDFIHIIGLSQLHGKYGIVNTNVGFGKYQKSDLFLSAVYFDFMVSAKTKLNGNYQYYDFGGQIMKIYTTTFVWRISAKKSTRIYYSIVNTENYKEDRLNFLFEYYLSGRNRIYFVANLKQNFKYVENLIRVGYEMDF
jgi:hypothetical protein